MKRTTLVSILLVLVLTISHPVLAQQTRIDFVYTSPVPGASYIPAVTTLTFTSPEPISTGDAFANYFSVTGTQSGKHTGEIVLSDDATSLIYKPDQAFSDGETVSVEVRAGIQTTSGAVLNGLSFEFTVKTATVNGNSFDKNLLASLQDMGTTTAPSSGAEPSLTSGQYKTLPTDFPEYEVTVPANGTGDGYLFFSNFALAAPQTNIAYLLIVDNDGEPVFYKPLPDGAYAIDFKKQPNGWLTYYDLSIAGFKIMDSNYQVIDTVYAGNGYSIDPHELRILPNGHMLLIFYENLTVDMTSYGGLPDATVVGMGVQELDSNKNVVFQWRSWDHLDQIPLTDTDVDLTTAFVDYVHGNAVHADYDGNLLISARHLSEVVKINRINGDIIWILGGKGNQFDFGSDEGFSYQHDIRRVSNGNITLFDNHNLGPEPHYSRAVEYQIDEYAKTVTRVWQFRNSPDTYGAAMGDAQRLPNGNTVIGWGLPNPPTITEVKPDGSKAFELVLGNGAVSYRAFRFPWEGHPTEPPQLVYQADGGTTTLYYSWNGATDIQSYKVYAGVTATNMTLLTEESKTGFETSTDISAVANDYCYFQVMPIDDQDAETQYSNKVFVPNAVCHPMFLPLLNTAE